MDSLIILSSGFAAGWLMFFFLRMLFRDSPLGRILGVIAFVVGGLLYFNLAHWANWEAKSSVLAGIIIFGPIGVVLLLALFGWAFSSAEKEG